MYNRSDEGEFIIHINNLSGTLIFVCLAIVFSVLDLSIYNMDYDVIRLFSHLGQFKTTLNDLIRCLMGATLYSLTHTEYGGCPILSID